MGEINKNTARIAILGVFTAIVIIQTFTFLGYFPLGFISLSLIQITVAIAAITVGTKEGMIVGFIWGLLCFIRALVAPPSPIEQILFSNPVLSILPRVCVGFVAGYIYRFLLGKIDKKVALVISGSVGAITNTILVLGIIFVFMKNNYALGVGIEVNAVASALMVVLTANGLPEAIISGLVTAIVCSVLFRSRLNRFFA